MLLWHARRPAITQARSATGLVGDVVLEIALGGGARAGRPGAGGIADLGQVAELDPGVVALGLEPVITILGGDRVEGYEQIWVSVGPGAQPPGAVSAGRPCGPAAVKENPGPGASLVPRGGSGPPGGPGLRRLARSFRWLWGSGRAQPCPMARPCWSVTVTHQVVFGLPAAAFARSRPSHGSIGPPGHTPRPPPR